MCFLSFYGSNARVTARGGILPLTPLECPSSVPPASALAPTVEIGELRSQKGWSILEDFLPSNHKPFPSQFKNSVEVWPLPLFPNNFFSAEAHFPFETKLSSLSWSFTMDLFCTHPWIVLGFPGGSEVKASACNAGDPGPIPGSGRSPGEGNGNLLQYSCLENPMDGRAWWATVHGVAKSRTRLNDFTHLTMDSLQMFTANSGASVEVCQRQFSWAKLKVNFWQFLHPAYFSLKSFPFSFPLSRSRRQWHPTPVRLPGKIPWMEEPSRLQSKGLLRVGHDWSDLAAAAADKYYPCYQLRCNRFLS